MSWWWVHTFLCYIHWETNLLLPFCLSGCLLMIFSMQRHFLLNRVFIHFLCKFIILLSLIMLCCFFPALTHQLLNIGINCVFISISLCGRGVLGDWHCAWPCEYTMLCINMSASTAIAVTFLECWNVNSHLTFIGPCIIIQGDTKKTGTFEKPNKNWRNPRKKNLLTETEPSQLAF